MMRPPEAAAPRSRRGFHRPARRSCRGALAAGPALAGLLTVLALPAFAASPPGTVNYQGVLRDAADQPQNGGFDMIFRFFDAATAGTEIMIDEHLATGTGAVTVSGGLFSVALGGGFAVDGSGPGTYKNLPLVFRDHEDVWVEIQVGAEVLVPRVRVRAAPYSHNATNLGGRSASGYIDVSSDAQVKAGDLTVGRMTVAGDGLYFSSGHSISSGAGWTQIQGDAATDFLSLRAGSNTNDGGLFINGDGTFDMYAGNGMFRFFNGAVPGTVTSELDASGNLQIDGDLNVDGGDVILRAGLNQIRGVSNTDDLWLFSGGSQASGGMIINGGAELNLYAGDGSFYLRNGAGTTLADLSPGGHLRLNGDATVEGGDLIGPAQSHFRMLSDSNLRFMFDNDNSTTANLAEWYHDGAYVNTGKVAELTEAGNLRIRGTISQNVSFDLAESFLASEPLEPGDLVRVDPRRPNAVLRTSGRADRGVLGVVSGRPGLLLGGAPFDTAALREAWGDEAHRAFLEHRPRLEAEVLSRHAELALEARSLAWLDLQTASAEPPDSPVDPAGAEAAAAELARRRSELASRLEGLALERFCEENLVPVALAGRVPVRAAGPIEIGDPLAPGPLPGTAMRGDGSGPIIGIALEAMTAPLGRVLAFVTRVEYPAAAVEAVAERQDRLDEALTGRTPDPGTGRQSLPGHLQIALDGEGLGEARFSIFRDGRTDGALDAEVFRVDEEGNVFARGAFSPASMDVAELFPVLEAVGPGEVVSASRLAEGSLARSREAYDPAVVGVVAADPGVLLGRGLDRIAAADPALAARLEEARRFGDREAEAALWRALEKRFLGTHAPVALSGTVGVKADAGYGAIRVGDLLAASPTPGHAMRADEARPGTILGKALSSMETGTGVVRMLVMPR